LTLPPENDYIFGISEGNHYLLPCGNVILFQNHRAVEGVGPYDPIIEQVDKPEFFQL
jgi:hypothetical protein